MAGETGAVDASMVHNRIGKCNRACVTMDAPKCCWNVPRRRFGLDVLKLTVVAIDATIGDPGVVHLGIGKRHGCRVAGIARQAGRNVTGRWFALGGNAVARGACSSPDAGVIKRGAGKDRCRLVTRGAVFGCRDMVDSLAPRRLAVVARSAGTANVFMIEAGSGERDRVFVAAFARCIGDDMRCGHPLRVRAVVATRANAFGLAVIVASLVPTGYGMASGARVGGWLMVERLADCG